ncbi:MAG: hypothetical protein Q8M80_11265, partial [Hydrogenophaga sp.]|nr:hypothetical protein [Hydrogenophaga sp.]
VASSNLARATNQIKHLLGNQALGHEGFFVCADVCGGVCRHRNVFCLGASVSCKPLHGSLFPSPISGVLFQWIVVP